MPPREIIMLVFTGDALLLLGLGLPLMAGFVTPNWFYGARTRKTVDNPEIWYPANEYAGRWLLGLGGGTLVLNLLVYLVDVVPDLVYGLVMVIGTLVGVGAMTLAIVRRVAEIERRL